MSNLKQLGLSMMMYTQDYDERFPSAWTSGPFVQPDGNLNNNAMRWYIKIFPYLKNTQVLNCPSSPIDWRGNNYTANLAYGLNFRKPAWSCCGIPSGANVGVDMAPEAGSGAALGAIEDATGTVLIADSSYDVLQLNDIASTTAAEILGNAITYDGWPSRPMRNIRARHLETINTLFVDGHVKAMNWKVLVATPGQSYKFWTTTAD